MNRTVFYSAARWLIVAAVVVMLGAGGSSNTFSEAEPADVASAVTAQIDMSKMLPGDNQLIKRFYGLDPTAYESCVLYYPNTNMMAEEVLIVKLRDLSQQQTVRQAAQKRIETQKNTFEGYGAEQFQLLSDHALIEVQGNYVLFVVNAASEAARDAFLNAL